MQPPKPELQKRVDAWKAGKKRWAPKLDREGSEGSSVSGKREVDERRDQGEAEGKRKFIDNRERDRAGKPNRWRTGNNELVEQLRDAQARLAAADDVKEAAKKEEAAKKRQEEKDQLAADHDLEDERVRRATYVEGEIFNLREWNIKHPVLFFIFFVLLLPSVYALNVLFKYFAAKSFLYIFFSALCLLIGFRLPTLVLFFSDAETVRRTLFSHYTIESLTFLRVERMPVSDSDSDPESSDHEGSVDSGAPLEKKVRDVRADLVALGKLKHLNPLIATCEYVRYSTIFRFPVRTTLYLSTELLTQLVVIANNSLNIGDDVAWDKLCNTAKNLHSVNIDRYEILQGKFVYENTILASHLFRRIMQHSIIDVNFPPARKLGALLPTVTVSVKSSSQKLDHSRPAHELPPSGHQLRPSANRLLLQLEPLLSGMLCLALTLLIPLPVLRAWVNVLPWSLLGLNSL